MARTRWAGVGVVALIAGLACSVRPGTLYVRIDNAPWTSVVLSSPHNTSSEFAPGSTPRLWPLQYGKHKVAITFADGRKVWLSYWHYDAGVRKRAEMIVERLPDGETVRITQIYNGSDNDKAEGSVSMSKTSSEKPFLLDGPV